MKFITLKAGGPRTVVTLEEAQSIRDRFEAALSSDDNDDNAICCHVLDLSCRAWPLNSLKSLEPALAKIAPTVRQLRLDDIIASLETSDGLASLGYLANLFGGHKSPHLSLVDLNDNAVGTRGMSELRPLLETPTLAHVSMQNCGLAHHDGATLNELYGASAVGSSTSNISNLVSLTLGRNQMGAPGATHVGSLLATVSLQHLSYAGSRPLAEGTLDLMRGLAAPLRDGSRLHTRLSTLDLSECDFQGGKKGSVDDQDNAVSLLCTILESSPMLQTLVLRDGSLEAPGVCRVLQALQRSGAGLVTLDLGANGELGPPEDDDDENECNAATALRDFLLHDGTPTKNTLQHLMLDCNELGDEGASAIVAGCATCISLRTLNLECNEIEDGNVLLNNPISSLQLLNLVDNMDISNTAALKKIYPSVLTDDGDDDDGMNALADGLTAVKM